jgi:hypothetical protein
VKSEHKDNAKGHTTTDFLCPIVIKETERVMKLTQGLTNRDFLVYATICQKNRLT